ncbi:MAG: ABC transporter substrate-binding protein [Anaerolineaceae bacterium]
MIRKYLFPILLILTFNLNACNTSAPVATDSPVVSITTEEPVVVVTEAATISAFPMTITDDNGREVTIDSIPTKIVSLSPSITEILFAVGAGPVVIGDTEYCDYPPEAVTLTKIGGYSAKSMSIETIVSLDPDLVLAEGGGHKAAIEALEQAKITVVAIDSKSFDDIYANIELVGRITDNNFKAAAVVGEMKARVDTIEEKVASIPEGERLTVFWEVWDEPLMTAGPRTFISQMIQLAGGDSIFPELTEDWPAVSAEEVVKRKPAVIMGPDSHGDKLLAEQLAARSGWDQVDAVKNNRIFIIDGNTSSRPGPRIVDALESIAKSLYPDLFK